MSELVAGSELDARVAEACGYKYTLQRFYTDCGRYLDGCKVPVDGQEPFAVDFKVKEFHPSTDPKAAFEAAEKVGLFKPYVSMYRTLDKSYPWQIDYEPNCGDIPYRVLCKASTIPLAICGAILAFKGIPASS